MTDYLHPKAIWISGNEKMLIQYMSVSHLRQAINKLTSFDGAKFKGLDKKKTLISLQGELEYRKYANIYHENLIKQLLVRKETKIFNLLDKFAKGLDEEFAVKQN